ncbi:hypothetical protein MNEG_10537, partial [Monoraphidium neglectum]
GRLAAAPRASWEGSSRRSMEEEVLQPDDVGALIDDDAAAAAAAARGAAAAGAAAVAVPMRAAKRDWALRSVIKVFVVKVDPSYAQPWQKLPQRSSNGSAFVLDVDRRLVITNAHVDAACLVGPRRTGPAEGPSATACRQAPAARACVANATTVYVRRPGDPKKTKATIACLAKQCDLALLTVADDSFWEGLRALTFVSETPELQSPVLVAGYPVGGDSLSITKGIVSRVCMTRYSQVTRALRHT